LKPDSDSWSVVPELIVQAVLLALRSTPKKKVQKLEIDSQDGLLHGQQDGPAPGLEGDDFSLDEGTSEYTEDTGERQDDALWEDTNEDDEMAHDVASSTSHSPGEDASDDGAAEPRALP